MHITPINEAEAIFEPFWAPDLSELDQWTVEPGSAHGLDVHQNWCWAEFEWARRPADGPALRMRRAYDIDCSDYDRLVLSAMAPEHSMVRIIAETDCGVRRLEAPTLGVKKKELALELEGAARLEAITIEVEAGVDGIAQGWFNWLGLQDSGRLAHMLTARDVRDSHWDKYLKDEDFDPQFTPSYGFILNDEELAAMRAKHDQLVATGSPSPFAAVIEAACATPPESLIADFINLGGDTRYNRERDHGKVILNHGLNAAVAGHLLRDKSLLRLAARYALSIGMCEKWDDGFTCFFPGSTWDHRCFVQSFCAYNVAGILDLAGEYFTELGRDFLLRRLAQEGIASISYMTWKHDYIFYCNQLTMFTPGRVLALAVMNRHWQHVRPLLDIAYTDLCENLEHSILPDGGYVEGPSYFGCVGRDAGLGIYHYSRAVGKPMEELIPPSMKRCGGFAEALASTDDNADMIPICDATNRHDLTSQAIMASLLPDTAWLTMMRKTVARDKGWPTTIDAIIAWNLIEKLPQDGPEPRLLVRLPEMGPLVSQRRLGEHWVKLFVQGNKADAGHTHEDKGSFVLEFAGETFAMDPGTCDYSHPLSEILVGCERHSMLIPVGMAERPHPQCPLPFDVKPSGDGSEQEFHATIDATPGWEPYYKRWQRTWDSPAPSELTITDDYELASGDGVEFYWQTRLPVAVSDGTATISGIRGRAVLEAHPGCIWRVDELPLLDGVQYRLAMLASGKSGTLTVKVRLEPV